MLRYLLEIKNKKQAKNEFCLLMAIALLSQSPPDTTKNTQKDTKTDIFDMANIMKYMLAILYCSDSVCQSLFIKIKNTVCVFNVLKNR